MKIYTEESKDMIKAGIIGSTGYAGGELARLLLQRDDVEIKWYGFQKLYRSEICFHLPEHVQDRR